MLLIFIFGAILSLGVIMLFKMDGETIITINSKHYISLGGNSDISRGYVAKKKKGRHGGDVDDWNYYNDSGEIIKDEMLTNLIHKTFVDEDWYGEYKFYVEDEGYYSETTSINDVQYEQDIIDSIEKTPKGNKKAKA